MQSSLPAADLYLPATHASQLFPKVLAVSKYPALQVQAVKAALPADESECIGHDSHVEFVEAPSVVEYVPGLHSTHVEALTAVENVPVIHALHCRVPFCAA
jgi:hypothetical protein